MQEAVLTLGTASFFQPPYPVAFCRILRHSPALENINP